MNTDSPVSAFAYYKSNPQSTPKTSNNKKSRPSRSKKNFTKHIPENTVKKIASEIKKQQKKKEVKNVGKKKIHKKKKSKSIKKKVQAAAVPSSDEDLDSSEDMVDLAVPYLTPIPDIPQQNGFADNVSSASGDSFEFLPVQTSSVSEALNVFAWMVAPYSSKEFFKKIWEKKPLHIARNKPTYYKDLISTPGIDTVLRRENVKYTVNIDITSYADGKRETHNPEGRAHPHCVWDYYLNGCSIRMLNPQIFFPRIHVMNATLQEYFNSCVGANAYLTPPDSQGFAPHYDDIEAFILQIEGKKHWRVYKPLSDNETLPRVSSRNFDQSEIGKPMLEVTLEAGDMLYFPRGYIHQAVTVDGEHSLHVTVSMYQKHSWADLFEKMVPAALQELITEDVELRQGLPLDIYDNFGLVHSDSDTPRRNTLKTVIESLCDRLKSHLPIDAAVDQMAKCYQQDALPPVLTDSEKAVTIYGDTDLMMKNYQVVHRIEIDLDTRIRLLRKNILRMVSEEDTIRLYFHTENALEYHGNELQFLEIDESIAPAIETLITSYPEYVFVENLNIDGDSEKVQVAKDLWERGILMTELPLESLED